MALPGHKEDEGVGLCHFIGPWEHVGLRMMNTWDGGTRAPVRKSVVDDSWRSFTLFHTPFDSKLARGRVVVGSFILPDAQHAKRV